MQKALVRLSHNKILLSNANSKKVELECRGKLKSVALGEVVVKKANSTSR